MNTTYNEKYNKEIIKKLSNLTHSQYIEMRTKSMNDSVGIKGEKTDIKSEVESIRKIAREAMQNEYTRSVSYKYGRGRVSGRLYSDGASCQGLPKFIRGALCGDNTIDIDAINCHPQLLSSMCKRDDIPHHHLMTYIQNRETQLIELMKSEGIDRTKAKELFLHCINKESPTTKIGRNNIKSLFFRNFDDEMRNIIATYVKKNPELYSKIQSSEPTNHGGKTMAWLLNEAEGKMLNQAINTVKHKYIIRTLAFDGLMLDIHDYDNQDVDTDELIKKLNNCTDDIGIKWSLKPHDKSFVPEILNLKCEVSDNTVIYGDNEMDIVEGLFKDKFEGKFFRRDGISYLRNNKQWITDRSHIVQIIREAVRNTQGLVEHRDGKGNVTYENITQTLSKSKSVINAIWEIVPENATLIEDIEERTLGKISFQNGYIDFNKGRFIPYTTANKDYDTINMIHRDFEYISPHDPRRIEFIKRVLWPMFCIEEENSDKFRLMEYFLYTQARAIAGVVEDKIFTMITGQRDCCKSVYNDLILYAFGKYVQMFNISTFQLKREAGEESRMLGPLLKHRHARLLTSQEISENWMDGVLLKKVSSGGDQITARGMYKDEETFVPQFKIMAMGNTHPRVKPVDAMQKCFKFDLKCKFVDEIPDDGYDSLTYYLKDGSIKKYVKTADVGNAMASLLIDYYKRSDTSQPLDSIEEDEVNIDPRTIIKELFEINSSSNDRISNDEFKTVIYPLVKDHFDSVIHLKKMLKLAGAKSYNNGSRGLSGVIFKQNDGEECCDI